MSLFSYLFFFNDTATTEIYTLSLHDALPISGRSSAAGSRRTSTCRSIRSSSGPEDRKSTRLNSSHVRISYAVFCLKKKKKKRTARKKHRRIVHNSENTTPLADTFDPHHYPGP